MNALLCALGILNTALPSSLDNDFDVALGLAGLNRATATFDPGIVRFFREGEFRTPFYESCYEDPWRIPFYSEMWKRQIKVTVGDPGETVSVAGRMLGRGTRRSLLGNPIQSAIDVGLKQGALQATLEAMKKRGLITGTIPSLANVPGGVQEAAAVILQVSLQTIPYRRAAFRETPNFAEWYRRSQAGPLESADPEANQDLFDFYRKVDLRYLFAAGSDLVSATKHAQVVVQSTDASTKFRWEVDTQWGRIVLSGGSNDTYKEEPTLLLIDTGGSDTYLNCASNRTATNWLSIVLDTSGDDRYLSDSGLATTTIERFAGRRSNSGSGPASAAFGVSVLVDSNGNDLYRSHRAGLGSAVFGVAYLEDSTGNDVYDAYTNAQGSAQFGIGILDDWKGDDQYSVFQNGQGFGGVMGMGMLIDRLGADRYTANTTTIDFPSAQNSSLNLSMAQGAATGRRADYLDGHSLSGGIGILLDEVGDDRYLGSVFAQGVGYWEGCGLLWDEAGNDIYEAQWYAQGASAHFGIGLLDDAGGDDQVSAALNMAMGAGHDFGIGMMLNSAGKDSYRAPNLSLGAGNANGIGVFVDDMGDDSYESTGITLGQASEAPKGSLRERALALGLFLDLGGTDTYPAAVSHAKNLSRVPNWRDRRTPSGESQVGVFYDR